MIQSKSLFLPQFNNKRFLGNKKGGFSHRDYQEDLKTIIHGEWIDPENVDYTAVVNPATGESIAEVPLSSESEVEQSSYVR